MGYLPLLKTYGLRYIIATAVLVFSVLSPLSVFADDATDASYSAQGIYFYSSSSDNCQTNTGTTVSFGSTTSPATGIGGTGNKDYAGRDILSQAVLSAVTANQPIYEQASKASGVPWQMIAVLHLRETGLKKVNPGNNQGLFQDSAHTNVGADYTPGPVTDANFLQQATWAGNFIKGKSSTPDLLLKGDATAVKDAFFGYNGQSGAYVAQAKSLGFTDGADGSPYVVNKLDAQRDPSKNPTGWGQIKTDGGAISYPANSDYGAFVVYASLSGLSTSGCSSSLSGTLNQKIVQASQSELALWQAGTLTPGKDYLKYTYGTSGDWCAWFVSYILKQAGKPVDSTATPQWPAVKQFLDQSSTLGFVVHATGDGYTPKPGDLAVYDNASHINIVTGYSSDGSMITIGGNQASATNGDFTTSKVSQNIGYGESATNYVEVK